MKNKNILYKMVLLMLLSVTACKTPSLITKDENTTLPSSFNEVKDSSNVATLSWKTYFKDPYLLKLIDTALVNNQELNITLQEIAIAKNEIQARKGEYLPFVGLQAGAGAEKVGRYTSQGANDATTPFKDGKENPEFLPDFMVGAYTTWEIDVWNKLHNAKKAAVSRYLATVEGKNFMMTNLVAEIANSYYELLALDNQLEILKRNVTLQSDALEIVKLQKKSTRVTELAVKRFEAQLYSTKSIQFQIQQKVTETENKLCFLLGKPGGVIERDHYGFVDLVPDVVHAGVPSELLNNRPDVKQAELELAAAKLDVKVAKARFYPSLGISAGIGYQAFNAKYLLSTPESLLYSIGGDLATPLINRRAIKAEYYNANAEQVQAVYNYERTILNAYIEVVNKLSNISNLERVFQLKKQEVSVLAESVAISNKLFRSARADYMEVLLTQREALESKFELIETKKNQMSAFVNIYKALGGGWK